MKIAVAQIDPVVGAFAANVKKVLAAYDRACKDGARVLLTPELVVCGYPPLDLLDRPEMLSRNEAAVDELARATKGKACALVVGHVSGNPAEDGRAIQNSVTVLENGKRVFTQAKTLLPTYDIFDEARYFEPAAEIKLWDCDGTPVALAVCEDLWANDGALERNIYGDTPPVERYRKLGARLVISISSSPYVWGKREHREKIHVEVSREVKAPLLYVNQMGATDEILFDGASFAVNASGSVAGRLPLFRASYGLLELGAKGEWKWLSGAEDREDKAPSEIEVLHRALVTGIQQYFQRTGFKKAVIGLSGGIDSALVAALAAQAIGAENVYGVAMPSQYSSGHSLADAEALAAKLGCRFEVRPIKFLFSTASRELSEQRPKLAPLALENLQSRLRGVILMTFANHENALVLTTGNKSELAMGYCTMYGDMCGALDPIGDLFKTRVYELSRYMNDRFDGIIPESSISKAPSAELRPDQKDTDSLPPYELLDAVLGDYIEKGHSIETIDREHGKSPLAKGQAANWVKETLRKLELNEYKRRQAAPCLKVSTKAFGIGRRIPIAKIWDQA